MTSRQFWASPTRADVDRLIAIAMTDQIERLGQIVEADAYLRSVQPMNLGHERWMTLAAPLGPEQLVALIKALTLVENIPGVLGGSVSPVIWLCDLVGQHPAVDADELANWVLAHTKNPYLPFGSFNYGARSLRQLAQREQDSEHARRQRAEAEHRRHLEAKERRAVDATRNLFGAIRRADKPAIAALLAQGADPDAQNDRGQTARAYAQELGRGDLLPPETSNLT